ncbi:MAG: lipid-A-disaccharide synthase, partial [Bacteroidota bacterium]|nr:lipid-A-disaccharide synthase [Bacteroidota bacterium]
DLHGAALIEKLKNSCPDIHISGIGGDKMAAAGMELFYHINKLSFLGFAEVIKHIPYIKKVQKNIIGHILQRDIKLVVLIDYPGFNLSIAKKLKALNVKVIYYISPQIWAWGAGRINKIRKYIDKMIVFFPFENDLYSQNKVSSELAGHPLVDRFKDYKFLTKEELYSKHNLPAGKDILLIMPGSRLNEISKLLPDVLIAANDISSKFNLTPVIACSDNIEESVFSKFSQHGIRLIKSNTYDLMKHAKIGIIKSGTSTLEAGILGLPMVIVYRTSLLTYLIGRLVVKVKNIGLINIVAGKEIVPELIQHQVNTKNIFKLAEMLLTNTDKYNNTKQELNKIEAKLGNAGASARAASIILKELTLLK